RNDRFRQVLQEMARVLSPREMYRYFFEEEDLSGRLFELQEIAEKGKLRSQVRQMPVVLDSEAELMDYLNRTSETFEPNYLRLVVGRLSGLPYLRPETLRRLEEIRIELSRSRMIHDLPVMVALREAAERGENLWEKTGPWGMCAMSVEQKGKKKKK